MKIVLVFGVILVSLLYVCEGRVTRNQRKLILDLHNKFRRAVAKGKVNRQPSAANMLELKWNSESASKAQKSANKCIFEHDDDNFRQYGKYSWVGQNIAYFSGKNISQGVQMWFNEVNDYTYEDQSCNGVCGHYTQLVWAKTSEIGCGISNCKEESFDVIYLFCNYATGGNFNNEFPYETGSACSKCPKNTKCSNGLCK